MSISEVLLLHGLDGLGETAAQRAYRRAVARARSQKIVRQRQVAQSRRSELMSQPGYGVRRARRPTRVDPRIEAAKKRMLKSRSTPQWAKSRLLKTPEMMDIQRRQIQARKAETARRSREAAEQWQRSTPTAQRYQAQRKERSLIDAFSKALRYRYPGITINMSRALESMYGSYSEIPGWADYLAGRRSARDLVYVVYNAYVAHAAIAKAEREAERYARDLEKELQAQARIRPGVQVPRMIAPPELMPAPLPPALPPAPQPASRPPAPPPRLEHPAYPASEGWRYDTPPMMRGRTPPPLI